MELSLEEKYELLQRCVDATREVFKDSKEGHIMEFFDNLRALQLRELEADHNHHAFGDGI